MNKYFLLLLVLTPYLGFAGKEADTSNFIQMGVARRARQHIAPLAPLMVGLNMNSLSIIIKIIYWLQLTLNIITGKQEMVPHLN